MLKQELMHKGVAQLDIEDALGQVDEDDERRVAFELAERKVKSMMRFDAATQERKLTGMLIRRGHSAATAHVVACEVVARTLVQ